MPVEYKVLTPEQRQFFLEHGWLRLENALNQEIMDKWLADFWIRLGYDPEDRSTWKEEYVKMPRHREVPNTVFMPEAWQAMCELVGGEDRLDPVRERYQGDQFIFNGGSEYWRDHEIDPRDAPGWHTDNDWYRQFLDSSGNALTVVHLFTDIVPRGGGTWVAEDGIAGVCKWLYDRPEGMDPPFEKDGLYGHVKECQKFVEVNGKKGDTFILHGLLPHSPSKNHLRNARIISNPHVNLKDPFNFNRPDPSDYSLVEQVIMRSLGRTSIPEYHAQRERKVFYPRTYQLKGSRIPHELARMVAAAGGDPKKVDSIHLHATPEELQKHLERNGLTKPYGPKPFAVDPTVENNGSNLSATLVEPARSG